MHRVFKLKYFLILLFIAVGLGGGMYFLHNYQFKNQVKIYLQKANQALAEKETQKALEYFERYLLLNPGDTLTFNHYAFLVDDSAKSLLEKSRSYLTLEKALRRYITQNKTDEQPPPELYKRAAVRALELRRYRDAGVHLETLLKLNPDDIENQEMMAQCKEGLGKLDEAKDYYSKIILSSPHQIKSHIALAKIYSTAKEYKQAENCLRKMVESNSKSIEAHLALITFLREQGRIADAARENEITQQIMSEINVDPADKARADWLYGSAELALAQRSPKDKEQAEQKRSEALRWYTQGIAQFPKDIRFYLGKARLELAQNKSGRALALETLHQAIPLVGEDPDEQWMAAKLLLDSGDKQQATLLTDRLRARFGANPVLEYLRARMLFDEGKLGEAVSILERIKDSYTRFPYLAVESDVLLNVAYERLDNPERRLAAVERILKLNQSNHTAQVGKADILASMGRPADAITIYRAQLAEVPSARLPLVRLLLAAELKKSDQQRDWSEIKSLLEQSSSEQKKSKEYVLTQFQFLAVTGKHDELEKAINQACLDSPKEVAYWMAKLTTALQRPGLDEKSRSATFEKTLQDAERAAGDHPEFRLAKGLTAISLPRDKALASLETLERKTDQWSSAEKKALESGLANLYYALGFSKDAKRLLKDVLVLDPFDFPAQQLLVDISIAEKDDAETQRLINAFHEKEGEEGYRWRLGAINRVFAQLQNGERHVLPEARQLVDELTRLRPAWFHTQTIQGRFLELTGQLDQAVERFKQAVNMGERDPDTVKKTVQLLTLRRRPEEARQLLALVLDQSNPNPVYAKLATEVSLKSLDSPAQTLAKAKQAVKADSKDYRDHLWLGNVQWAAGKKAGAESSFKQAVLLGKDAPEAWANWIVYLVKVDRKKEAEVELKRAEGVLQENVTYVLIAYYQALDQRDKAEEQYVKLVNKNPNDATFLQGLINFHLRNGEFAKAEAILKKQIDSPLIDTVTLNWVRRNYALTLAVKPDYTSFKEAVSLVEKNLKENPTSPDDLRTRALILSTRPGPRQDLIKDLEIAFAIVKPTANEALLLAQLYEGEGNWTKAESTLADIKEGQTPNFLAYYVQALLRHKELEKAAKMMDDLEKLAPGQPLVIEPNVRLLVAQGKQKDAVDFLEAQASQVHDKNHDPIIFLNASRLLEQLDLKPVAEQMVKKYVAESSAKNPNAILALIELYGRQGRIAEALHLCEENWSKLPVGNVSMASVAALNSGKATPEQIKRIETRLLTESKAARFDIGVAIALADLYTLEKRPVETEAIYRKILDQVKDHPVALNNLAWLLSERHEAFGEAIELITRAIDKYGPEGAFLDTRGMIFLRNGKTEQAIKDLSEAVTRSSSPDHWLHLAYAQHQAHQDNQGEKAWKKAQIAGLKAETLSAADKGYFQELAPIYHP